MPTAQLACRWKRPGSDPEARETTRLSQLMALAYTAVADLAEPLITLESLMNLRILAAGLVLASSSAMAAHCPADMKKIDAALAAKPALSEAQMTEVKKHRADGEALHKAGKHKESVDTLGKAMKLLKI